MEKWIERAVGKMHVHHITHARLGQKLGYSREYTTRILNGKDSPPNIKERIMTAINEIIQEDLT